MPSQRANRPLSKGTVRVGAAYLFGPMVAPLVPPISLGKTEWDRWKRGDKRKSVTYNG